MPDFREPVPTEPSPQWLSAVSALHRQTAEAHLHFQDVLAEAHRSYLRTAEGMFAALADPGGYVPAVAAPAPALPPAPAPLPPAPVAMPPAPPIVSPSAVSPPLTVSPPAAVVPPARPRPPVLAAVVMPQAPLPAEPASTLDIGLLLDIVADKTGYPVDMLGATMDLESDLGIDSIKKVEIFSTVRQRVAGMPPADSPQMAQLFQLRTLEQIVRWAGRGDGQHASENASRDASGNGDPEPPPLRRCQPQLVAAPAFGLALAGLTDAPLVVVDGGSGLAAAVVDHLAAHHIAAIAAEVPEPDSWGVILLHGLADPRDARTLHAAAFRAARRVAARMAERGGVFVTVQDTGGRLGLAEPDSTRAALGGLAALARTAALEWPRAAVRAVDCERGARTDDAIAEAIVEELLTGGATLDVGLRADGSRWTIGLPDTPPSPAQPVITAESVLVATGGARGITAAALRALAAAHRPRMLLVGRTELADEPPGLAAATDEVAITRSLAAQQPACTPAQLTARARAVLAVREIRAMLADIARAGSEVRYACLDVTDQTALQRELDRVRHDWGPVTAVVHGAGWLADRRIADKTDEQFAQVYDTKVAGWYALMAATATDPLRLLCVFSSVAARFGNPGQSDYAMANETLNHLANAERGRRPDCRVVSIGWGPWAGGMVTPSLATHFISRGIPLIPLDTGAAAFVSEVDSYSGDVVVAAGIELPQSEIAIEVTVSAATHAQLADHTPAETPVLPFAVALEWFAAAARSRHPTRAVELADVRVLRRVDLPDLATGHRFTIHGHGAGNDEWDLSLHSASGAVHYRARLVTPGGHHTHHQTASTGSIELGATNHIYDSPVLFHGPRCQSLLRIDALSATGADARVIGVSELGWAGDAWCCDPAAVDGALQAAVLWVSRTIGEASLPMGVDRVLLHRLGPAPAPARCVVSAATSTDGQTRCDIALFDPDGGVRTELFGVSLIRRPDLFPIEAAAGQ